MSKGDAERAGGMVIGRAGVQPRSRPGRAGQGRPLHPGPMVGQQMERRGQGQGSGQQTQQGRAASAGRF